MMEKKTNKLTKVKDKLPVSITRTAKVNDKLPVSITRATKVIANAVKVCWDKNVKPVIVVQGGQGAGKTYGILQILITLAAKYEIYVIVASEELTKMRMTVIRDFLKIIKSMRLFDENQWKFGTEYTFKNGGTIKFIGLDKEDVGKGLRSDILFVNEANKVTYDKVHELVARSSRKIFDYNPNSKFWIDEYFKGRPDVESIVLTYKDNELLSEDEKKEILAYKERGYKNPDIENYDVEDNIKSNFWANKWRVYGLGVYGKIDGLIYDNWKIGQFDDTLPYRFGLDFGFSNDPDAMVKVAVDEKNKKIYAHECIYRTGQNSEMLKTTLEKYCKRSDLIIADSAEARLIKDLRKYFNIVPTIKWKVVERIKKVQSYELIVTPQSDNLILELESYTWSDKKSETPIDANNHLLDALGYAVTGMTKFEFAVS